MILRIIALDAVEDEHCQNLVDEYHEAGLIENCLTVDISRPGDWKACFPNEEYEDLVPCLSRGLWSRIVVVSVRKSLNDSYPSDVRVAAEVELRGFLANRYSSSVPLLCMTLSQMGDAVHESMFPANYQANYLHQTEIDVDVRLPRVDVSASNIDQVLVFTALTLSGAGRWVKHPTWHGVNDFMMGTDRQVRFVKAQTRIGICGPLVANLVKAAVRPGGGMMPAGLPPGSFVPMNEERNEIRRLAESFIVKYGFRVTDRAEPEKEAVSRVGLFKALKVFFKDFGRYLRAAAVSEWQDRVERLTAPLLTRVQDITFGEDSTIVIKGARHELSGDALAKFAEELKSRLDGLDGVTDPKPTPDVWRGLVRTSFALLDGDDFPEPGPMSPAVLDVPMSSGKRILFMNPGVVGPALDDDVFTLSSSDCKTLGLDSSRARSVSIFESREVDRLREEVHEAIGKSKFRADLEAIKRGKEESEEASSASTTSRLRGTLSRTERLEAVKAESDRHAEAPPPLRDAEQIGQDLDSWLATRETLSRDSFIAHLFESLDNAIEHEVSSLKWDALAAEIEELKNGMASTKEPKLRLKRVLRFFGFLLLPLLLVAVLVSSVLGLVTAVFGVPILVFVAICWGTSFALALVVSVVRRALAQRRLEFEREDMASEITRKYHDIVHAINEFRRLQLLRVQFFDWQRLVRELVHNPYGKVDGIGVAVETIDVEAIPPQLVVARLDPSSVQATNLRNIAEQRIVSRGYLGDIYVEMKNDWEPNYGAVSKLASFQLIPELDVSAADLETGIEHEGRKYFFARKDFVVSSIDGALRADLVERQVRSLSDMILHRQIDEVFSTVKSGLNAAFSTDTPSAFLSGLERQGRTSFSVEYFSPENRLKDGVEELDPDYSDPPPSEAGNSSSSRSGGDLAIAKFLVSGEDQQILLASTRVDVSHPFSPERLQMYTPRGARTTGPVGPNSEDPPV